MSDEAFAHERLDVWQEAITYASLVYRITRTFPADERYGLTSQLRRAAVSISSNIAEGNGRSMPRDKIRFVEIAYGSLMETLSQIEVASNELLISQENRADCRARATVIARQLSRLRSALERRLK